ncbi:hypothetical protein F5Y17DRAFT_325127 [Xylariaceae sp. FL0594]|nr:hypothetical protein F5Y17DRAFT_325127 [Xylariaceae sp. FL0594]
MAPYPAAASTSSSLMPMQEWPPQNLIALLALLISSILAPIGWVVQRYWGSASSPSSPASPHHDDDEEDNSSEHTLVESTVNVDTASRAQAHLQHQAQVQALDQPGPLPRQSPSNVDQHRHRRQSSGEARHVYEMDTRVPDGIGVDGAGVDMVRHGDGDGEGEGNGPGL